MGITAPEYNYDDYAGLDVKGKIVIVLRHEPQEFDDKSVFDGKVYTAHSQIFEQSRERQNAWRQGSAAGQRYRGASERQRSISKNSAPPPGPPTQASNSRR